MKDACSDRCPHADEIRDIIRETVRETLRGLGVDTSHPFEVQADLRSLREWRQSMKAFRRSAFLGIVGVVVSGACAALWIGFKSLVLH